MNKARVLVVEDENIVALDIERGLKRLGYDVSAVVNNGKDAIREVSTNPPDLILMDIQIQGNIDGIETAGEIHKHFNVPVVFLTAYADEATLQRAKAVEPYGYLLKPFDETELHTAVEVVLQKHKSIRIKETQSQEALLLSEARFKLFVDSNKDYALYMLDKSGNVMSWNAGAERIKGYDSSEVIGKNFRAFYTEEDRKNGKPEHELEIAASTGKYEGENWQVRKDGSKLWASVIITALKDAHNQLQGFGKVTRDLTATKAAEDGLRNSIIVRDEFMSIASHELRTPLAVLLLQLQMAQRMRENGPTLEASVARVGKALDVSQRQAKILTKLIDELLDVTRIQAGKFEFNFEKTDLSKIVASVCQDFEDAFHAAKIKFECDLQEKVEGTWDRFRLEQVVTNLLNNVIKYAPGSPVKIVVKANDDTAFLSVEDHGSGIPKEMQTKIFERFERVGSPSVSGLGLGLYISRQIVMALKGTISLESELGKGSIFSVALPRVRPKEMQA